MATENQINQSAYEKLLKVARTLSTRNIKIALQQQAGFQKWAVNAYKQALRERGAL